MKMSSQSRFQFSTQVKEEQEELDDEI